MKLLKKIDDYLLHFYPSVWITRLHYFLPIGLGLILLIFGINVGIGWNPKEEMPNAEWPIFLMVIPVLIYLVYWFIFQSRYNVEKSGGKMSYGASYLNFFLYALVFTVAYFFILVIPYSNDQKMVNAVSYDEVKEDIAHLNQGNSIVNFEGEFKDLGNGNYRISPSEFVYVYSAVDYLETSYAGEDDVVLTRREVLRRIENYVASFNKYTRSEISDSPEKILDKRLKGEYYDSDYDNYGYYGYDNSNYSIGRKLSRIQGLYVSNYFNIWAEAWFWKISFALIGWLALLVWIFKEMNLRHFVFGFISICLTPILSAIILAILFGLFYGYSSGDSAGRIAIQLVLILYVVVGVYFVRGYLQNKLNQTAYVLTMYFQFWIPIFPLFVYGLMIMSRNYYYNAFYPKREVFFNLTPEELVYWICILIGLASIAIFKPIYAKFRSLPMEK